MALESLSNAYLCDTGHFAWLWISSRLLSTLFRCSSFSLPRTFVPENPLTQKPLKKPRQICRTLFCIFVCAILPFGLFILLASSLCRPILFKFLSFSSDLFVPVRKLDFFFRSHFVILPLFNSAPSLLFAAYHSPRVQYRDWVPFTVYWTEFSSLSLLPFLQLWTSEWF